MATIGNLDSFMEPYIRGVKLEVERTGRYNHDMDEFTKKWIDDLKSEIEDLRETNKALHLERGTSPFNPFTGG